MQVTITPRYVDAPKPGKKNWNVKDEQGVSYSVPPKFATGLQVGVPVTLSYEINNYQGKNFNMVDGAMLAQPQPQPGPSHVHTGAQQIAAAAPPVRPVAPQANGHATAPAGTPGIYFKERCMFVMAAMKALSADRGPNDVRLFALAADEAWSELEARWHS